MKYRIYNIKLEYNHKSEDLRNKILDLTNLQLKHIKNIKIIKRALDARKKRMPYFVYTIELELKEDIKEIKKIEENIKEIKEEKKIDNIFQSLKEKSDIRNTGKNIIIIGFGVSGIFCAYFLTLFGIKPIIIEQGVEIEKRDKDIARFINTRKLNEKSNYLFGEGGAGTYSDGKLNTNLSNEYVEIVLETLIKHGATPRIQYIYPPHIGSDKLKEIIKNIRNTIINRGGIIKFNQKVIDFKIKDNKITEITTDKEKIESDIVVLAIGSHDNTTFEMLKRNKIYMEPKPFQMGVRIEHPQKWIEKAQLGRYAKETKLHPIYYKLVSSKKNKKQISTFCMCPGGIIIPAVSQKGLLVTNGMSDSFHNSGFSNSALVCTFKPEDIKATKSLDGLYYRTKIERLFFEKGGENYTAPAQYAVDFINDIKSTKKIRTSYAFGTKSVKLSKYLPKILTKSLYKALIEFDRKIEGFIQKGILIGPETRASCPIRIKRDKDKFTSISHNNLYPIGEGAGYAGGIISAAIDGIKCAIKIIENN